MSPSPDPFDAVALEAWGRSDVEAGLQAVRRGFRKIIVETLDSSFSGHAADMDAALCAVSTAYITGVLAGAADPAWAERFAAALSSSVEIARQNAANLREDVQA